ncbi:MAG: hypothetical protein A2Z81_03530 [Omnitrophica WOR_2 bacterium GWA2_45_18]|nr:MAG: hypothetical protein A2Z81_03530 [Omnitrophica WOR_2 bacterium GWA2_45_18]
MVPPITIAICKIIAVVSLQAPSITHTVAIALANWLIAIEKAKPTNPKGPKQDKIAEATEMANCMANSEPLMIPGKSSERSRHLLPQMKAFMESGTYSKATSFCFSKSGARTNPLN